MVVLLALKWWYSAGWQWVWRRLIYDRIIWLNQAFSIVSLMQTWFSPFKQTYRATNKGSIDLRIQASVDNFISRFIGALMRTIIIIVGLSGLVLVAISGMLMSVLWPLLPLMPAVAVILIIFGVGL